MFEKRLDFGHRRVNVFREVNMKDVYELYERELLPRRRGKQTGEDPRRFL